MGFYLDMNPANAAAAVRLVDVASRVVLPPDVEQVADRRRLLVLGDLELIAVGVAFERSDRAPHLLDTAMRAHVRVDRVRLAAVGARPARLGIHRHEVDVF